MTRYNNHMYFNDNAPVRDGTEMPPAMLQRMPMQKMGPSVPYDRRSYCDGFYDGFCEGASKILELAGKVFPFIKVFK